jgi:hypothetical protein
VTNSRKNNDEDRKTNKNEEGKFICQKKKKDEEGLRIRKIDGDGTAGEHGFF